MVDPMRRMTIPEIRQHPWFQARLPRYLAVPPPDTLQQAKKVYFYIFMSFSFHLHSLYIVENNTFEVKMPGWKP